MDQDDDDDFRSMPSFFMKKKPENSKIEGLRHQKSDTDSSCPICQWSFKNIAEHSRASHLTACKGPVNQDRECPLGIKCCKTESKHYRYFAHHKLAVKRSLSQEQFKLLVKHDSSPKKKQKISKELRESGQTSMKLWVKSPLKLKTEMKKDKDSENEADVCKAVCTLEFEMNNEIKSSCMENPVRGSGDVSPTKLSVPLDLLATNEFRRQETKSNDIFVKCEKSQTLGNHINREITSPSLNEDLKTDVIEPVNVALKINENTKVQDLVECESTDGIVSDLMEEDLFEEDEIFNGLEEFQSTEEPCSFSFTSNIASASTDSIKNVGAGDSSKELWKKIFYKGNCSFPSTSNGIIINPSTSKLEKHPKSDKKSFRQCPFYKRIPETTFVVDAFQYGIIPGVTHYFLSHFHSDHYGGLRKSFNKPIVCSRITAALVSKKLSVDSRYLRVVEVMEPFVLGGATITPLDANHCPGSLMFLFQLLSGKCFLHVGDFRATAEMETYPVFCNINVDILFLDTTYCQPRYEFPKQEDVVSAAVQISLKYVSEEPATLIVSGTYTIGKEKIFLGIADALDCRIWAPAGKREVLKILNHKTLTSKMVDYPQMAQVHVLPMRSIFHETLEEHLRVHSSTFKRILAFNPTGWNYNKNFGLEEIPHVTVGRVTVVAVPYSEHSSFNELRRFVKYLKPTKVVPTVQSRNITIASVSKLCAQWLTERDRESKEETTKHQQKLTAFFSVKAVESGRSATQ